MWRDATPPEAAEHGSEPLAGECLDRTRAAVCCLAAPSLCVGLASLRLAPSVDALAALGRDIARYGWTRALALPRWMMWVAQVGWAH